MNIARILAALLALSAGAAQAHRPSDAFLTLNVEGAQLHGQWEIALRDLDVAAGVDANQDRALTWGELKAARGNIDAVIADTLKIDVDGKPCAMRTTELQVNDRVEGRFAWIGLTGECPSAPTALRLTYTLLFDVDPTHRGILVLNAPGAAHTAVFSPDTQGITLQLAEPSRWRQFTDYLREGVHHIWIGADHILFLVSLLLPCVLVRSAKGWSGTERFKPALWDVVAVVTAFTAAHSITLTLAALGVLRLPTALTESAIAASVFFAALNNVWPLVTRGRWGVAFGFGLVHGFGFASVLGELGLPAGARLLALVAFNLGVETGQLTIVALVLPLAYLLRNTTLYRRGIFIGGSLLIAAIAAYWFAQRSGLLTMAGL